MRRYRLPVLLGIVGYIFANIIGALINVVTGRLPADSPYLSYTLPALGVALLIGIGVLAWQYKVE